MLINLPDVSLTYRFYFILADRTTSGIPAFLPMSPMASNNSAGNNGVILLRSSMKRFHTRAASHSNSSTLQVPAVEKVGGSTAISSLSSHRRFLSAAMDVWQEHKRLKGVIKLVVIEYSSFISKFDLRAQM